MLFWIIFKSLSLALINNLAFWLKNSCLVIWSSLNFFSKRSDSSFIRAFWSSKTCVSYSDLVINSLAKVSFNSASPISWTAFEKVKASFSFKSFNFFVSSKNLDWSSTPLLPFISLSFNVANSCLFIFILDSNIAIAVCSADITPSSCLCLFLFCKSVSIISYLAAICPSLSESVL